MRNRSIWLALFGLSASLAVAQDAPAPAGTPYQVKHGDTLEGLAQSHLGDHQRWQEIWHLNPELQNPHVLQPGQRILLPGPGGAPSPGARPAGSHSAEIKQVARRVEEQTHPEPWWTAARVGQVLKQRDGVRTYERSSAELGFDDGTSVRVTEQSLVFLRGAGVVAPPLSRRAIEIVEGQADVVRPLSQPAELDIEVRVGSARALPRASSTTAGLARARPSDKGGAQFMVYGGSSDVLSGGQRVAVDAGMGTSVVAGRPPGVPERLLAAPSTGQPLAGTLVDHANPKITWSPVDGAVGYVVEVCRDPECSRLVDRARSVSGNQWRPEGLPVAELHWRVTAVSASGLDGFPSPPVRFAVRSLWRRPLEADPDGPAAPAGTAGVASPSPAANP